MSMSDTTASILFNSKRCLFLPFAIKVYDGKFAAECIRDFGMLEFSTV